MFLLQSPQPDLSLYLCVLICKGYITQYAGMPEFCKNTEFFCYNKACVI